MARDSKIYRKNPNIVFRKIADEYILVPIQSDVGDLGSIYSLNEVACCTWELIDGKRNAGQIKDKIAEGFEVNPEEAEKDLIDFLKQLEKVKAVE